MIGMLLKLFLNLLVRVLFLIEFENLRVRVWFVVLMFMLKVMMLLVLVIVLMLSLFCGEENMLVSVLLIWLMVKVGFWVFIGVFRIRF